MRATADSSLACRPVTVDRPLVIVSNRGPLSFSRDADGGLVTKRAGGGLVTALGAGVAERGALWVALLLLVPVAGPLMVLLRGRGHTAV